MLYQFAGQKQKPPPGARVVYVDGGCAHPNPNPHPHPHPHPNPNPNSRPNPNPNPKPIPIPTRWDMFHAAHVSFLEEAAKLGDYLLVR